MNNQEAAEILKVIADESRITIIRLLLRKKKMYGAEFLPYLSCKQATLSHHMNELCVSGLVRAKKKGNKINYSIDKDKLDTVLNLFKIKYNENENAFITAVIEKNEDLVEEPSQNKKAQEDVPVYLL